MRAAICFNQWMKVAKLTSARDQQRMLLARIKSPEESHAPWDYYLLTGVVPAKQAFRSLAESKCKLK